VALSQLGAGLQEEGAHTCTHMTWHSNQERNSSTSSTTRCSVLSLFPIKHSCCADYKTGE
jgi:hypothetical protein